jgi:hypothetical protein
MTNSRQASGNGPQAIQTEEVIDRQSDAAGACGVLRNWLCPKRFRGTVGKDEIGPGFTSSNP